MTKQESLMRRVSALHPPTGCEVHYMQILGGKGGGVVQGWCRGGGGGQETAPANKMDLTAF